MNKDKKILVVDDEEDILTLVEDILHGFTLISTTDPLQALEIFKSEEIALVISDYKMPSLNGLELYAEIKKLAENKPEPLFFMMTSGFGDNSLEEKAYAAGVNEFFKKPINDERLRAGVEELMAKSSLPAAAKRIKILVVDDERDILVLIEQILGEFEVISTTDPRQALEIYSSQEIALVIADYIMPVLNGLELYVEIKKLAHNKALPLIYMITCGIDEKIVEEMVSNGGIDEYFRKPINEDVLLAVVKRLLSVKMPEKSS